MGHKWIVAALVAALAAFATGCGDTPTPDTAAPADSVSQAELDAAVDEAVAKAKSEDGPEDEAAPEEGASKVDQIVEDADEGSSGDKKAVPDVTGMDHQLAQDTMQAAGFYMLDEVDCSGQDRMLLWDRNWTVEAQKPSAGSKASTDATITLCSVKDGE